MQDIFGFQVSQAALREARAIRRKGCAAYITFDVLGRIIRIEGRAPSSFLSPVIRISPCGYLTREA